MKHEVTAKRLKDALYNKGMKAQDLVRKTGVDKSSVSQYVNGQHRPSEDAAKKMASVLGVDYLWLMGYDTYTFENNFIVDEAKENYKELQRYMSKLNDKGVEQVSNYIKFIASQEEYKK